MSEYSEDEALLSPALSAVSFISSSWRQKSPSELVPILKTAYRTLKVKENGKKSNSTTPSCIRNMRLTTK